MKKTVFLLLMCMASIAHAQIIVTSTSAYTYTEVAKSNRVKGWVIRPEIEMGSSLGMDEPEVNNGAFLRGGNLNIGYQLNPYIALGIGGGWNMVNDYYLSDDFHNNDYYYYDPSSCVYYSNCPSYSFHRFPVYANLRGYFCNRKVSPYYDLKIGYAIGNKTLPSCYVLIGDAYEQYGTIELQSRYYFGVGLGLNWKNFDFGISSSFCNNTNTFTYTDAENYDWDEEWFDYSILFHFAYNFQIPSKKATVE